MSSLDWSLEEEAKEGFLVATEVGKESFTVGDAKGKAGFQRQPVNWFTCLGLAIRTKQLLHYQGLTILR